MTKIETILILLITWLFTTTPASTQTFDVDTLTYNGNTSKYINMVILGDGYTSAQMSTFVTDAIKFKDYFFSVAPYANYKNYYNVFIIKTPSLESGIKHPRTATDCPAAVDHPASNPTNYFGTTFDTYGIHRLVVPANSAIVFNVLATNFPSYDQVVVLGNSPQYGGSGGTFATSTIHTSSGEVAVHEIGHSFAKLGDEYWAGTQYAYEQPNMTQDNNASTIKWKQWLTTGSGVGIYQHTGQPWYKPAKGTCKMEVLNKAFCGVCTETTVEKIHSFVNPMLQTKPATSSTTVDTEQYFSIAYIQPTPNTMRIEWTLNGNKLANNIDSVLITKPMLIYSSNTLTATLIDTTILSRNTNHLTAHLFTTNWTISAIPAGIETSATSSNKLQFSMFPNPSNNLLHIRLTTENTEPIEIRIVTVDGKILQQIQKRKYISGDNLTQIDISDLPQGTYFIELKSATYKHVEKFVKM